MRARAGAPQRTRRAVCSVASSPSTGSSSPPSGSPASNLPHLEWGVQTPRSKAGSRAPGEERPGTCFRRQTRAARGPRLRRPLTKLVGTASAAHSGLGRDGDSRPERPPRRCPASVDREGSGREETRSFQWPRSQLGGLCSPPGTAPIPEPPREPQLLQACGGLPVQELAAAFSRAVSRSGLSQLDFATRLRPQLNSKSTPFFPLPGPRPRLQPSPPRSRPADECPGRSCPETRGFGRRLGLGTEREAAARPSEIDQLSLSSRRPRRSNSQTRSA